MCGCVCVCLCVLCECVFAWVCVTVRVVCISLVPYCFVLSHIAFVQFFNEFFILKSFFDAKFCLDRYVVH